MAGGGAGSRSGGGDLPPGEDSDEALVRAVRNGDRDALETLVRRYLRPVHAVAASFFAEPEEVEDTAQETFLRALGALDGYDPRRPFAPWLYQIARNVARNRLAARARWKLEELPLGGMESPDPGPEVEMERTEARDRVVAGLMRLPEQRRTAFRLVDVEEMSAEDAGRIMGLTPGTVRSHVHHARRELRKALGEYAEAPREGGG
ncbi:MAG: sigma-70 family RNA polymerase sigma factor [Gemmatimonadota bacterium]